jgi:hypothetical protein
MASRVQERYDPGKETIMIELTEQQAQALEHAESTPPRVINPRTKETFVLLRAEEYERLTEDEYDDSPWTREELQALAWEGVRRAAARLVVIGRPLIRTGPVVQSLGW